MNRQQFINMLLPGALMASKRTGVDPRIILGQAALESAWGRKAPGNNYFGIKSHGKSGGQTFGTHEFINGRKVGMRDSFRTYATPEDSVAGYADFLLRNPRYRTLMQTEGLENQARALQASGYATDPKYGSKVLSIAQSIPLDQNIDPVPVQPAPLETAPGPNPHGGMLADALKAPSQPGAPMQLHVPSGAPSTTSVLASALKGDAGPAKTKGQAIGGIIEALFGGGEDKAQPLELMPMRPPNNQIVATNGAPQQQVYL